MRFFYSVETIDPECEDFFTLGMGVRVSVVCVDTLRSGEKKYRILGMGSDKWIDVVVDSMSKEIIEAALSELVGEPSTIESRCPPAQPTLS